MRDIRDAYMSYRMSLYLLRHPNNSYDQAKRSAVKSWNQKMRLWKGQGYIKMEGNRLVILREGDL